MQAQCVDLNIHLNFLRAVRLGKKHSADTRSLKKKQNKQILLEIVPQPDEDTLNNISQAIIASDSKPKRNSLSEEYKAKLSKAMLGNKLAVGKRAPLSQEHKVKIRNAMIGRKRTPLSEEHKAKISETLAAKKRK